MRFFLIVFLCLFNLSLMGQAKTLDDILEKHKGKDGISSIKSLLERGINAQDDYGRTALIWASRKGYTDIVKALISHRDREGAAVDLNIRDDYGRTALIWASRGGDTKIAKALIEAGADVNIKDRNGETALILASFYNHTKIVVPLIDAGVDDLNIQYNNRGRTALIWASSRGDTKIVKALIEAGADVNIKDDYGNTALDRASNNKIEALLKNAAGGTDSYTITLEEVKFSGVYTGVGLGAGYIDNDNRLDFVNFVLPIQLGATFVYDYGDFDSFSIKGDFTFDFGIPFHVGGTAGLLIDFIFFDYLEVGVGGGYRWISEYDKNIEMKETGFPYARITFGGFFEEYRVKPTFFVDFIFPDEGNFGINAGFVFMFDANYLWAWPFLLILGASR